MGGDDGGVVPGDIIVPKVIGYYQDYVGLKDVSSCHTGIQSAKDQQSVEEKVMGRSGHDGVEEVVCIL